MVLRSTGLWIVESVSLFRLVMALVFTSIAFQRVPLALIASCYLLAMASDLVDGALARHYDATTHFGRVIDLVSDKSLTIVSLLYAAARGLPGLPLALIAMREIIMIGMRLIIVAGAPLLPTNRIFGGVMAFVIWGNTLFLIVTPDEGVRIAIVGAIYWLSAVLVTVNLAARVHRSLPSIKASLVGVQGSDRKPPNP